MKTLKLAISIIIILSMLSYIVISACSECGVGGADDFSYTSLGTATHQKKCTHCHHTWVESHTPEWHHEGTCWDQYGNKYHEFVSYCQYCDEFLEFGRTECTGAGCIYCAIWGN